MLNDDDDDVTLADDLERGGGRFRWTTELKDEFCSELQKLVALDFLMLNTDRGLDNFVRRFCLRVVDSLMRGGADGGATLSDDPVLVRGRALGAQEHRRPATLARRVAHGVQAAQAPQGLVRGASAARPDRR